MAKSIGKMIYENKAAEIQKKKQNQEELIAAKKVALDPDEVVSKMPVPQASKYTLLMMSRNKILLRLKIG